MGTETSWIMIYRVEGDVKDKVRGWVAALRDGQLDSFRLFDDSSGTPPDVAISGSGHRALNTYLR